MKYTSAMNKKNKEKNRYKNQNDNKICSRTTENDRRKKTTKITLQ